jgi:site-specific DNA-cytosine methylase
VTLPLTHASFFSGIGGFDVGMEYAGFRTVSHSEVKPYSCAVLETHWPDVPNLGDLNTLCPDGEGDHDCVIPRATVWTGGVPCSDFSIMGRRKGLLGGNRSSLGLVFLDLVRRHRPQFVVLENVPGLLTASEGRDLGTLLGLLVDIGYGWSFRLLDARDFGLPQARRRLFIVASPDPRDAGAVLDDSTDRRVDAETLDRPERAALAGGAGGADGDHRVVVGPTYTASSESLQRREGDGTFPLTPNNYQYVVDDLVVQLATRRGPILARDDGAAYTLLPTERQFVGEPIVVERHGHFTPQVKRDGAAYTVLPVGAGGNIGEQYVTEPVVLGRFGTTPERLRDDGAVFSIVPPGGNTGHQYVTDALVGRDGGGVGGRGDGTGGAGRGPALAPGGDGGADHDWVIPAGPAPADHADGVRTTAGPAGRLDDSVGAGDGEVGPKHLDTARWHVLGRTVPVPIVEWIGLGIRSVLEQRGGTR